ncbi:MAG: sulfatase [Pirellulales bacterium]|nr:sulfatase [Pirellulales bacterium]
MSNRLAYSNSALLAVFVSICIAFLVFTSPGFANEPKSRPNVLFIAVDDLRPELGCYGSKHIKSPNLDRLAASGVVFTRAYCQEAVCNPSRASLLAGLRPDSLRVWDLKTDFRTTRPDVVTLPQQFMRHGYHAVAIGKIYHNTKPDPASWSEKKLHIDGYPFDPDAVYRKKENLEAVDRRRDELIRQGLKDRYFGQYGKWYIKTQATECVDVPDNAYYDGAQTDVAIKKLAELKERKQPFFFAVGYYRPHLPFNAPKKYWDLYDRASIPLAENDFLPKNAPLMAMNTMQELRSYSDFTDAPRPDQGPLTEAQARLLRHGYYASVSYTDAQIGRLLDGLKNLGLEDNTIVIVWGDHGWKLGEHRSWCKMTNCEMDTRAPLIIRAPGVKENGRQCDRLVEFVDIYPTLCELAGLPLRDELEGTSFVPLLEDRTRPWKTAVFSQYLRDDKWTAPDGIPYMGRSIRTDRYRYTEWTNQQTQKLAARELYDHRADPAENTNLADQPDLAEVQSGLARRLHTGWKAERPK